jgi:hypothetical protein
MTRTIAEKMFVKPGTRAYLVSVPDDLLETIQAPPLEIGSELTGQFGYIHLFGRNQRELENGFTRLKSHLATHGALWVSWPKGGQLGTDLNLHEVIRIGYARGLVESTCVSIDSTWSALRFTHPKPGKKYNNSHAELALE